ncbi:hypothetical protein M9458_005150, partial [Cirrhinus mrigala]
PARPILSVQLVNETSAAVIWTPQQSSSPLLEILGFRLTYGLKNDSQSFSVDFRPEERQHNVTGLRPGGVYSFLLAARGRSGYGEEAQDELSVPEFPPKGFPQLSERVNATCCSLRFTWLPPNGSERNDVFTGYALTYEEVGGGVEARTLMLPADASSYTVHGLNPDRAYAVRMSAHNGAGCCTERRPSTQVRHSGALAWASHTELNPEIPPTPTPPATNPTRPVTSGGVNVGGC